jgi:nicotinate-nucleotide adenylyltransferase
LKTPVVGIFGGTFDPFHGAHLRMARAFVSEADLSELRLIPAGQPYHRHLGSSASAADRLEMVRIGIADDPIMVADDREIRRAGQTYTIDTLEEVRAEIGPDIPLWFLIGADSLARLQTWRRWRELFDCAHLAVAMRPGFDAERLPEEVRQEWDTRLVTRATASRPSGTILRLALEPLDLSASNIRDLLTRSDDISRLVPPAIASYILKHGLYR